MIALNAAGNVILAFADNADSMWLINPAHHHTPVCTRIFMTGERPSQQRNTAYVLNCGTQCGAPRLRRQPI